MLTLKWAKKHSPHFRMNQSVTLTLCVPREHRALKRLEDFSISFCPQGGKTVGRWGTLQRPFFCGYQRQLQQSHWNQNYNVLIRMSPHLQKAKSFEAFWLSKKKKKTTDPYTPDTKHMYSFSMEESIFLLYIWSRSWSKGKAEWRDS